jgi:multidrug efflux system membrane fusion protein
VPALARDVPVYLEEIGKCVAREMVSVQPQVSGRITTIHFSDGADLKTGDPLVTIDPRPYRAQLDSAEGNLAQNRAVLDLAKTEFARAEQLLPKNAIAQSDHDQAKNAVEVALARVKSSEAAVETAKLNLEYCEIHSPIDGRAGQRLVDLGNVVTANSGMLCSLLVIQRLDPIYADFTVTENDLSAVQRNMKRGTVRAEVRLPDEPSTVRSGDLTFVDNAVQDATPTIKLRATIPNADHHFWPGRFVKVRLVLNTLKAAVLIPASAPQLSAKGWFVYVVDQNSTAELRPVKLGQRQGDLVVVEQGVKPGEQVITLGQMAVMPGGKVLMEKPSVATDSPPPTDAERGKS